MNRYKAKIDISKSIDIYFDVPLFTGDSGNSVELSFFMRGEPYPMTGVTVSAKRADGVRYGKHIGQYRPVYHC